MSITIPQLVPEIREEIYKFCDIKDIMNIAVCSKEYYETVKYILWHFLRVKWKEMPNKDNVIEKTKFLSMTIHLYYYCYKEITEEDKEGIAESYEYMLNNCHKETLYSLHFNRYIVKDGLTLASQILPDIKEMSLSDINNKLNPHDWDHFCDFKQLRRISIYSSTLPDSTLSRVCDLTELKELIMVHCSEITDIALKYISEIPNLTILNFSNHKNHDSSITTDGYVYTANLVGLIELNFSYSDITHHCFEDLSHSLKNVTQLDLTACFHLKGEALVHITKLTTLKHLDISYCQKILDDSLKYLPALTELYWLSVCGSRSITDDGLFHLAKISSLKRLNLSGCTKITNAGLTYLPKLEILEWLNLWGCENLTDDGLTYVSTMKSLTELNISYCIHIRDSGLLQLTKLSLLKILHLVGCESLTNQGLSHVSTMLTLTELDISYCDNLTDSGLLRIQSLQLMRCLTLFGCKRISDQGIADVTNLLPKQMTLHKDENRKYIEDVNDDEDNNSQNDDEDVNDDEDNYCQNDTEDVNDDEDNNSQNDTEETYDGGVVLSPYDNKI